MFTINFDMSDFERKARQLDAAADQVPFALSRTLNEAVEDARNVLINDTWPGHVTVRNPSFIKAALHTKHSTKGDLAVEINDVLKRATLGLHAKGGVKSSKRGVFAIPVGDMRNRRGTHGIPPSQRPRSLTAKKGTVVTPKGIFTATAGRLKMAYVFKPSTPVPADVPFREDFEIAMREGVKASFPKWISEAMRTRRS